MKSIYNSPKIKVRQLSIIPLMAGSVRSLDNGNADDNYTPTNDPSSGGHNDGKRGIGFIDYFNEDE